MIDKSWWLAALAALLMSVSTAQAVTIDWVPVGDGGNDPDTRYATPGYGSVAKAYCIGKYEVTNAQYAEFLNGVAAVGDAHGLYNIDMGGGWRDIGGISRTGSGTSGDPWDYSARTNRADRPVNFVSWYDALRFANWLHNGQPSGVQDASTTEDGAYDISLGSSVVRKPGAVVFLPSQNEWYKAAYYKGGGTNAGYWDYPTQSDTVPTAELPPGTDTTNGSANYYTSGGGYLDTTYYTTEVGAYYAKPSDSAYRTFDQGGNVWEWNEALFDSARGIRGGSISNGGDSLHASNPSAVLPALEDNHVGFRVALDRYTFGVWASEQGYRPGNSMPPSVDAFNYGIESLDGIDRYDWSSTTNLLLIHNQLTSIESGAFSGLSSLTYLGLHNNVTLTDLNLEAADFSSLTAFNVNGNSNTTSVSLRNALVNQTSLDVLMNGGYEFEIGIGELGGVTEMDLSGVDFRYISTSSFHMMDDLTDLWLVDTRNLDGLDLSELLDELDTMADPNTEGALYMTQADFDAFNVFNWLANWAAEPGHAVEFLQPGDMNHDTEVNNLDMERFMEALLAGPFDVAADMNEDGVLDGRDVAPFVAAVQTSGSTQLVPEPATLWLTAIGLLCVLWWRRAIG